MVRGSLTSIRLDGVSGAVKCRAGIKSEENKGCWKWDADASGVVQNTLITARFYLLIVI